MRDLGFTKGSVMYGGKITSAAIFTCQDCGAEHAERIPQNGLNPEALAKKVRAAGWDANSHGASGTRCPDCKTARRAIATGDSSKDTTVTQIPAQPASEQREPTAQQRLKIRGKLDSVFDDEAGCYLDGYSDQKIGEELNLPWSWVAKIREAAYGPIRVDPEVAALRAEIIGLQAQQKMLTDKITSALARLEILTGRRKAS